MAEPRYLQNDLKPVATDTKNLDATLNSLKRTIASSIELLIRHVKAKSGSTRDSLYTGDAGIALMFLRFSVQLEAAGLGDCLKKDIQAQIPSILNDLLPPLKVYQLRPGHLSPLDSPVGSAVVYILSMLLDRGTSSDSSSSSVNTTDDKDWAATIQTLGNAVKTATEDQSLGGDEVLYGRAGLLWAMLNLQTWASARGVPRQMEEDIAQAVNPKTIEQVIGRISEAGKLGARWYGRNYGEEPLPLMWFWHDKFYLGAILNILIGNCYIAGILTVLLQAPKAMITPHIRLIMLCISALCDITVHKDGYLPSSLPAKSRTYEYTQICHGSPGLLVLLATFRFHFPDDWREDWGTAEALAAEKVWEEGLVRKGIGICHGVSGNAWTLLLQGLSHTEEKETSIFLSRALAFLLKSTELPPLVPGESTPFRTPDHPYSLFEGLAGAVCAWIDACVIIRAYLGEDKASTKMVLGFPGLGGASRHGYL
ncbi:hypothetical protein ACEPAG_2443 [Sanghuangporus baumii]